MSFDHLLDSNFYRIYELNQIKMDRCYMNWKQYRSCIAIASLAIVLAINGFASAQSASNELTVVSFNIRYGTAADGENHWDKRRDYVVDAIREMNPDLLGTQETLGFQRDYLAEKLGEYDYLGVGRDDGKDKGEMMALYYRRSRFEKLDGGHFWLSETPGEVGSKSWDSSLPRMVTWVKLRDKAHAAAPPILFMNTHFDHKGQIARLESAKLIRNKVTEMGKDCHVVVTGDFNAAEKSPPYAALFSEADGASSPLVDTYRQVHPQQQTNEGTFSNFKASEIDGPRIDWIAVSRTWQIQSSEIVRTARDGRTPSDHFPVKAVLKRN
jgi:endonuclease/exonuclease/phosphatase family metal-dependent hydrolase